MHCDVVVLNKVEYERNQVLPSVVEN